MDQLSKLTPAETLILVEGDNVQLTDLLSLTLMDLFLKQVLQTTGVASTLQTEHDKATPKLTIIQGTHFNLYRPLPHEEVFTSLFNVDIEEIPIDECVRVGYKKAKNENHYSRLILKSETLQPYFVRGLSRLFNGKFSLTPEGREEVRKVKAEIQELEILLTNTLHYDQAKVRTVMQEVKGNVFLIKNLNLGMMREIERRVLTEKNAEGHTVSSSFPDVFTWLALDMHFHSFNNTWDDVGDSGFDTDFN